MPVHSFPALPRYQALIARVLVFCIPLIPLALTIIVAAVIIFMIAPWRASAIGVLPPDRAASLCERLGYPEPDCVLLYEIGRDTKALLRIEVDSDVSEPDEPGWYGHVHATGISLQLKHQAAAIAQTYQINSADGVYGEGWDFLNFLTNLWQPPCIFGACVEARTVDEDYIGLTEVELTDLENVLEKLIWQTADAEMTAALQEAQGATGLPVITQANRRLARVRDEVHTSLATAFEVPVIIRFACSWPGDGCAP